MCVTAANQIQLGAKPNKKMDDVSSVHYNSDVFYSSIYSIRCLLRFIHLSDSVFKGHRDLCRHYQYISPHTSSINQTNRATHSNGVESGKCLTGNNCRLYITQFFIIQYAMFCLF